jgi:hypothetical protein
MRRIAAILIIISALICSKYANAQTFFTGTEYGIALGGSQYFGDLNENYGFKSIRPAVGAFTRFHLNPFISTRLSVNITQIGYDDKLSTNVFNKTRNLNFQSNIYEGCIQTEFNFFRFATGELKSRFTPYLTGGIGIFYFDPYTSYGGTKYYLRSYSTEGKYYSNLSLCFPVGAGFKYWIRPGFNFGMEITDRLTVTDYMDDVSGIYLGSSSFEDPIANALQDRSVEISSETYGRAGKQRGNSATKDQYMMLMINLSFQLKTYKCPSWIKEGYYLY